MNLKVPFNWDIEFVDELHKLGVRTAYSRFAYDVTGGAHDGFTIGNLKLDYTRECIAALKRGGIDFEYSMDGVSQGNLEYTPEGQKATLEFVQGLLDMGVQRISLGNITLIRLILERFGDSLRICGSAALGITCVEQVLHFQDLGLAELELPTTHNRDFSFLAAVRKHVRIPVVLTANSVCHYFCPYSLHHALALGHCSQCTNRGDPFVDYYLLNCRRMMTKDPKSLIMSRWIRPEDLAVYERAGFESFRVQDLVRNNAWLVRMIRAYRDRSYDGNLLDIMAIPFDFESAYLKYVPKKYLQLLTTPTIKPHQVDYVAVASSDPVYPRIDNKMIPTDFLDHFKGIDCFYQDCDQCGFCEKTADAVFSFDHGYAERKQSLVAKMDKAIASCLEF